MVPTISVELHYVRTEHVENCAYGDGVSTWDMYVTAGVLKHEEELVDEKNALYWIGLDTFQSLLKETFGCGNCLNFLWESQVVLGRLSNNR